MLRGGWSSCSSTSPMGQNVSLYYFLDCILVLRKVWRILFVAFIAFIEFLLQGISHFVQLANDSEEVPKLKNKMSSNFKLSRDDWDWLSLMHEVLCVRSIKPFFSTLCLPDAIVGVHRSPPVFLKLKWTNHLAYDPNSRVLAGSLEHYGAFAPIHRNSTHYQSRSWQPWKVVPENWYNRCLLYLSWYVSIYNAQ